MEPVESGGRIGRSAAPHAGKEEPFAGGHGREGGVAADDVQPIAGRAPDDAGLPFAEAGVASPPERCRLRAILRSREGTVHTIVDAIMAVMSNPKSSPDLKKEAITAYQRLLMNAYGMK